MNEGIRVSCGVAVAALVAIVHTSMAGPLTPPPGPVASTPKPLAEIEPRTAISAVNTPGDANSLFKITAPGSYYLTGNVQGVAGFHGIEIATGGVTIDLCGFALIGAGGAGSFDGVNLSFEAAGAGNIAIVNGTIRGWSGDGIDVDLALGTGGRIVGVHSHQNAGRGIAVGQGFALSGCSATNNGGDGIKTGVACSLINCVAKSNSFNGIFTDNGGSLLNCSSLNNVLAGFRTGLGSTITACTATANSGHGIESGGANTITGCTAASNLLDGIRCIGLCTVRGCNCATNGAGSPTEGAGIHIIGSDNLVEGNNCIGNDRGIDIDSAGNVVIRNACSGNTTTNWDIAANNVCGPIVDQSAPGSAAILGNSAPSSLGTPEPNANFTY